MTCQALVLKSFSEATEEPERRTERRVAWIKRGTARRDGTSAEEVTLHDLSQTGCCISSNTAYAAGDRIELRFPNLPVSWAEVMWIRNGTYGCHFDTPLASKEVRAVTLATF